MAHVLVTALYDLGNFEGNSTRRQASWYLDNCDFILNHDVPIVIFTEPQFMDRIRKLRGDRPIVLIERKFEDLLYFNDQKMVDKANQNIKKNPFGKRGDFKLTASYMMLMWNKFVFVQDAIKLYPDAKSYSWIDFGIGPFATKYTSSIDLEKILINNNPEKVTFTALNPIIKSEYKDQKEYFSKWKYRVCGNFWSVGRESFPHFFQYIFNKVENMLDQEFIAPDEEILACYVYEHPKNCDFFFGDYNSSILNRLGLKYDINIAKACIDRACIHSLHSISYSGYRQLIEYVYSTGGKIEDLFDYLTNLYIHSFYLDQKEALNIAIFILQTREMHPYCGSLIFNRNVDINRILEFSGLSTVDKDIKFTPNKFLNSVQDYIKLDCLKWLGIETIPVIKNQPKSVEFSSILKNNFFHFAELQKIISNHEGERLTSSYLMRRTVHYYPDCYPKQLSLFSRFKKLSSELATTNVIEIGVNAGHSLLIMLLASINSKIKITAFDICEYSYTKPCVDYLNSNFGNRITLIEGRSPEVYRRYLKDTNSLPKFDLIHVDGSHHWNVMFEEILLSLTCIKSGGYLLMGDTNEIPYIFIKGGYLVRVEKADPSSWSQNSYYQAVKKFEIPQEEESTLCKLSYKYRTDKCPKIKHNYTKFYHHLFYPIRKEAKNILEMGIGTTRLMGNGYTPGASLRSWRDYFSTAHIFGLDYDKSVLKSSDRISCYYTDQSKSTELLKTLHTIDQERKVDIFDVIIDDGSHVCAHQLLTFNVLFRYVKPGGLYVIEDVNDTNLFTLIKGHPLAEYYEQYHLDQKILDDRMIIIWRNSMINIQTQTFKPRSDQLEKIYKMIQPFTELSKKRIENNMMLVDYVTKNKIQGAIVEIGVWKGGSIMSMIMQSNQLGTTRKFYIYDTFSEITPPKDVYVDYAGRKTSDYIDYIQRKSPLNDVKENVFSVTPNHSDLFFIKGDINKNTIYPDKISILRIGVDLYESIKHSLKTFYPLVESGGYVIINDYGHQKGSKKATDEFVADKNIKLETIDYSGVFWVKP
uniref:Methyltransferase n=1 Tax=Pithovirus LCPAC202 TaxID=2506592 RepID=A0A481Z858_9VIRU|nr:MAG: methyltransferase [Pithovirus LCPAC202]